MIKSFFLFFLLVQVSIFISSCSKKEKAMSKVAVKSNERVVAKVKDKTKKEKQILFGDLHVHTTYSLDAYMGSLPLMNGDGTHPPSDACDFARYCSKLDFWSINDHAEGLTPYQWKKTKQAIIQCNKMSGDEKNPDMVSFLGWEWSQSGSYVGNHYGHRNIVLKNYLDGETPDRPIGAKGIKGATTDGKNGAGYWERLGVKLVSPNAKSKDYKGFMSYHQARMRSVYCDESQPWEKWGDNCLEEAATPEDLFNKLDLIGQPVLAIPHGTTWGNYTPAGIRFDKQLKGRMHRKKYQRITEIYSGHGSAEEYRDWRAMNVDYETGERSCPKETPTFIPSCRMAGRIIYKRCMAKTTKLGNLKFDEKDCKKREKEAIKLYVDAGPKRGRFVVPGAPADQWLESNQCTDCFLPAFNHRPGNSTQYMMAITNFDKAGVDRRFKFGFIGSSDNHTAKPGAGYKEVNRFKFTESNWVLAKKAKKLLPGYNKISKKAKAKKLRPGKVIQSFRLMELERMSSFFYTGGVVAIHSKGRSRDDIWDALQSREVYATSGPRILLWFDFIGGKKVKPMGSSLKNFIGVPKFKVKAQGSFKQIDGCDKDGFLNLSGSDITRIRNLCKGECYRPSTERHKIDRVEVVKITPQKYKGEPIIELINNKFFVKKCGSETCEFTFDDKNYSRDSLYYVKAIQEKTPAINAGNLRCKRDVKGRCISTNACRESNGVAFADNCREEIGERAWSSPIYVGY